MNASFPMRLSISAQADLGAAQVKVAPATGRSQNGQPVEYGEPLFIIG